MDVRFDAAYAEKLIDNVNKSCNTIGQEATKLLDLLEYSGLWDDTRSKLFRQNIERICRDLEKSINMELDCMDEFKRCVDELRG